jgi:hypothetical protein
MTDEKEDIFVRYLYCVISDQVDDHFGDRITRFSERKGQNTTGMHLPAVLKVEYPGVVVVVEESNPCPGLLGRCNCSGARKELRQSGKVH